ncbi:MAG: hypothetical protein KA419_00120 [Acidobacteria bacterium]|nr:hypothetical protein [Acidobacteriota bacterium]
MEYDKDKVDECALAMLYLTLHDEFRAWKRFDFHVMDRLHEKGFIENPRNKTQSVVFTVEGLESAKTLFEKFFAKEQ